jgi:hypothetical protein
MHFNHIAQSCATARALRLTAWLLLLAGSSGGSFGQSNDPAFTTGQDAPAPLDWTTRQDHDNMKQQLGIVRLRPGPSGQPGATNSANYDPAEANPFPDYPALLTLRNGEPVTTAEMWWKLRRPEIVEDFEREVYGRVPASVPKVSWSITTQAVNRVVGEIPVNARQLAGRVDNSACPAIEVNLQMTLVTPRDATRPVPVLMMFGGFGGGGFPRRPGEPAPAPPRGFGGGTFSDPPSTEQLIAAGWGYATIIPGSIQADNGAGRCRVLRQARVGRHVGRCDGFRGFAGDLHGERRRRVGQRQEAHRGRSLWWEGV